MSVVGINTSVYDLEEYSYFQVSTKSPLYKCDEFIEFASNLCKCVDKYEGLDHFVDEETGEFSAEPFYTIEMAEEFEKYFDAKFVLFSKNKHLKKIEAFVKYFTNCPHCKTEQETVKQQKVVCEKCNYVYEALLPKP